MRVISLFSGAGGLDLGLIQAGNTVIWANDIDENAVATYKENIGDHIVCDDIKNIAIRDLPDAEVVVGGFPCQGFSLANRRRSIEDERNQLYRFFYDTIKEKQPKFFIAENVKGILSLGKGEIIRQIVDDFKGAGYLTEVHLVNMADYGYMEMKYGHDRMSEQYYICDYLISEIEQLLTTGVNTTGALNSLYKKQLQELTDEVERKRVQSSRIARPNQAAFRKKVLAACQRCVITNVTMPEILEAAHIKPFKYKGEDTIANGFAMRTDIHTLFDTGHLRISPEGVVELSQRARMDYGAAIPPRIVIPDFTDREFLRWRWENYNGL